MAARERPNPAAASSPVVWYPVSIVTTSERTHAVEPGPAQFRKLKP